MSAERRFRAMGTDVHIIVHGDPALVDLAEDRVMDLEARWSRFLPTSDVSRLNAEAGSWVAVSPETTELVQRALDGHRVTHGRFDPTVLGDVVRAGYDRSYEDLAAVGHRTIVPSSPLVRGAAAIEVDGPGHRIRLGAGTGFDPGGIGKGLAADLVAAAVDRAGAAGVLVNVGGDLRTMGIGPGGDDWTVGLDPAASGAALLTVVVERGAVATSTTLRRRWRIDGADRHHLIDPSTGRPTTSPVVAASVLAAAGWQAEVLAKAALLAGVDEGIELIESLGADGLLVDSSGRLHRTGGLHRFITDERAATGQLAARGA